MSVHDEIVALQEELKGYAPEDRVSDADAARLAALVRKSALKRGLPAKVLHELLEALAKAIV